MLAVLCTLYLCLCGYKYIVSDLHCTFCWLLPSNQSVYRQIASYWRGVGAHRVEGLG